MVTARKRKKHIQVERTTDALVTTDDGSLDEVRKTLIQVRQQYDAVHHEAEQKEARLRRVREEIRTADLLHASKGDDTHKLEENWGSLKLQYQDTLKRNKETQTARKVYEHMLARIQKEQAILKQKLLRMEEHMDRKRREVHQKRVQSERARCDRTEASRTLEALSEDAELEARACRTAREAFNASAGRLRKLYAIEKLSGNSLQRITFEQVERSQNTEDGFQKIRDVTGLADVMDIVHKFLNRDVEHEQLQGSVKEAEVRLEALRQAYDAFKQKTEAASCKPDAILGSKVKRDMVPYDVTLLGYVVYNKIRMYMICIYINIRFIHTI
ncbi:unnamed protein product [Polarella glacialis]|uniref:Uncharacterized protein n=1 Tax=Polarella glacialis TaxID=89957 RepID=A0A813I001_POLGL|nr:unnamed protein product [Polarella glacialis]